MIGITESEVIELPPIISEPDHYLSSYGSHFESKLPLNKESSMSSPESVHELTPCRSEQIISTFGSHTAYDISLSKEMSLNLTDLQASDTSVHEQMPHIGNSVLDGSIGTGSTAIVVSLKTLLLRLLGGHSVRFWTNGGLLGLEPSKPPDFTMSIAASQGSLTKMNDESVGASEHNFMHKSNGYEETLGISSDIAERIEKDTSFQDDQHDSISNKKTSSGFLPADRDSKSENSSTSHHNNEISRYNVDGHNENGVMAPECAVKVAPDVNAASTDHSQERNANASRVFGLSHKLLRNSFHRRLSLDEKSGPASSMQTDLLEKKGKDSFSYQSISQSTFREQFVYGSIVDSRPSSPPLEHMKISFCPIDRFDANKLKLKFPYGSNSHESVRDMFPSFQLVPESTISVHDSDSNSDDDDTFCKSPPYLSDDCLSHHSDSNSEQWESGETPKNRDQREFDSFRRISSSGSIPRAEEVGRATNVDVDMGIQENKDNSDPASLVKLQNTTEPTPLPPPLPPMQWRVSKPDLDMTDDMQQYTSQAIGYRYNMELSDSSISQQPKSSPAMEKQSHKGHEAIAQELKNKPDLQKLNEPKDDIQPSNGKDLDEREDFLHQIRTRSFNLRRTVTAKPNVTPGSTTNIKVTAILEKANAIRQAVASDDGEDDDNWSET
ncbi:protein SCAR3-like isoform X2 [Quillaja saponaria]|uniref:Protein SCAR n=1 Tax=Quillaja saponaria TaxID=32244 RepID=A0AAD7P9W6_QUISA|nr:protein SCAR3-like isoform X2 [Quillaja saponaria]